MTFNLRKEINVVGENIEETTSTDHDMTFSNIGMTTENTFSNLQPQFDDSGPEIPVDMRVQSPVHSHATDNYILKFDCSLASIELLQVNVIIYFY